MSAEKVYCPYEGAWLPKTTGARKPDSPRSLCCSDWFAEYAALEDKLTGWGKPTFEQPSDDPVLAAEQIREAIVHLNERFSEIISSLEKLHSEKHRLASSANSISPKDSR